ncbi:hypothetical protein ES705_14521 [subsurface metagenome]
MAKRFINTEIFEDSWFMDLTVDAKLLYIYLFTNCDHAGIIDINWRLIEVKTGIKQLANSYRTVTEQLGNRLIHLKDNYFFLPKFIKFQYPGFPKSTVRQQEGALKHLIEFGLWDEKNGCFNEKFLNSCLTVNKQFGNPYEDGSVNDTDNVTETVNDNAGVIGKKEQNLNLCLKNIFLKFYHDKEGIEYIWDNDRDSEKFIELIQKFKDLCKEEEDKIPEAFQIFLEKQKDEWVDKNFSIAILNMKFNEIVKSIKNPKGENKETNDYKKSLYKRMGVKIN